MGKQGAKDVLASNVEALRALPGNPSSQSAIAREAGVDQTTVGRVLRKANSVSVDALDGLAKAFRCQAWQLLVPRLDASRAERLVKLTPLALEVAELFAALPPRRQRLLYAQIQDMHNPDATEGDQFSEMPAQPAE